MAELSVNNRSIRYHRSSSQWLCICMRNRGCQGQTGLSIQPDHGWAEASHMRCLPDSHSHVSCSQTILFRWHQPLYHPAMHLP